MCHFHPKGGKPAGGVTVGKAYVEQERTFAGRNWLECWVLHVEKGQPR
jgi:hypothetical protein